MGLAGALKLGTRGSKLALVQAETVQRRFQQAGIDVEIVPIKTSGDKGDRDQLGAFVREIQRQTLSGNVDLGLHCLKDIPTANLEGLRFSAFLERENPLDCLISRDGALDALRPGAVVGTGSLRRTSQIAALRPDLQFKPLVGNVDTRLQKLRNGEYDAIVLAIAGLDRLGLTSNWPYPDIQVQVIDVEMLMPAPGQAVLVLETREGETHGEFLHHGPTKACSIAERAFLKRFGGGCSVPVGAYATTRDNRLILRGLVASADGKEIHKGQVEGPAQEAEELGKRLAGQVGGQGGFRIVDEIMGARI